MKRLKVLLLATLVTLVAGVSIGGMASAHTFRSGSNVTLSGSQPVNDTVFAAGNTIDISAEIFGDVFVAGQTITISGTVHGDVIAAGQTITVNGPVDGDIRLAGQTINVGGDVSGNATVATQSFVLDSDASIARDLSIGATSVSLNGNVGRDVAAGSNSVNIDGEVGRNVEAHADNVTLESGARVSGNVDVTSEKNVQRDSGAVVGGKVTRHDPPKQEEARRDAAGIGFGWFLYALFAMLFTALAIALLAPRLLERVTNTAFPAPWIPLLVGFLAGIVMPALLFVIAITVIGIPLAIILGLAWLLILLFSGHFFAYYIGRLIFSGQRNALLTMLVGAAILLVVYFIPVIGFLALLASIWIGSGMILLSIYRRTPRPSYRYSEVPATTERGGRRS
jgi:cytoskeletal protein CcmA (bactofilin family)